MTLVSGPTSLPQPLYVDFVPVTSAQEMCHAVQARSAAQEIIIKAAAVADYRPAQAAAEKRKKSSDGLTLELARTEDILAWLGRNRRPGQFLCGFSMETQDLVENSQKKLNKKHADLIAANSLREPGAGFGTSTNVLTLITRDTVTPLPMLSKDAAAHRLLDEILRYCTAK